MKYQHSLNPNDFDGNTAHVLRLMQADEYAEDDIGEVNHAFNGLYTRLRQIAGTSREGLKDSSCRDILKTIHMMARLWADLWLARGNAVFNDKLIDYHGKAQKPNASAHDQLLFDSLLAIAPDPEIIERTFAKLKVTSRLRSRK